MHELNSGLYLIAALPLLVYILHMQLTQDAPVVTTRVDKLNIAATLYNFHKGLDRNAWGNMGWGAFALAIGLFMLARGRFGWINVALGLLLVAEGLYQMRVREPRVIKVSAATLGLLGLWNLTVLAISFALKSKVVGVNPLVAIIQLLGAWATYKSYALYVALTANLDSGADAEFKALLDQLKNANPATAPDVVEFTSSKSLKSDLRWRVRATDGFMFFMGNEMFLGRKKSQPECFFVAREQVRLELLGEKMFSSKQKVRVTAGATQLNGTMSAEMAQKLMMLC